MNITPTHLEALKAFGYTEVEAQFLYLVATHSGYFTPRQFLAFTGAHWGKRTTTFWRKLQSQKHARDTFVITNNHFQGKAVVNALQLIPHPQENKSQSSRTAAPELPGTRCHRGRSTGGADAVSAGGIFHLKRIVSRVP